MKTKQIAGLAGLTVLGFLLWGCNGGGSSPAPNPSPSPTSTGSGSQGGGQGGGGNTTVPPGVYTRHYDNTRSGVNPNETILSPANVVPGMFGKIFTLPADGYVYAQPLYVPNVGIAGGTHNVVYVATANNSLYAYDADSGALYWQNAYASAATGYSSLTSTDTGCPELGPSIGISGTPVIDPVNQVIYFVTNVKYTGTTDYFQFLHEVNITNGQEVGNSPQEISIPGLDALHSSQRPGLALNNGILYVGFSSHCDQTPYAGTIASYDAATLEMLGEFQDEDSNTGMAGIWMSGMAPAIDSSGYVYASTGNGLFDGANDFGCSILKLATNSGQVSLSDFFAPFDQATINTTTDDQDLSSAGVVVLPPQPGSFPNELVAAGKEGQVYLLDRDNLGGYDANDSSFQNIIQSWNVNGTAYAQDNGVYFGTPAFFNDRLYMAPAGLAIRSYQMTNGTFDTTPVDQTVWAFGWPGGSPAISANGTSDAVLWFVDSSRANNAPTSNDPDPAMEAVLLAYDANNLAAAEPLFDSDQSGPNYTENANDVADYAVKHVTPTVFNGHVYIGTKSAVDVYGLIPNGTPVSEAKAKPLVANGSGASLLLSYDPSKSTCPKFSPGSSYQFVIQACGGTNPPCASGSLVTAPAPGAQLERVSVPVSSDSSSSPLEVSLAPGTYELLPATNLIPNNGGADNDRGTAQIAAESPFVFTVPANGTADVSQAFTCTMSSAVPLPAGTALDD